MYGYITGCQPDEEGISSVVVVDQMIYIDLDGLSRQRIGREHSIPSLGHVLFMLRRKHHPFHMEHFPLKSRACKEFSLSLKRKGRKRKKKPSQMPKVGN